MSPPRPPPNCAHGYTCIICFRIRPRQERSVLYVCVGLRVGAQWEYMYVCIVFISSGRYALKCDLAPALSSIVLSIKDNMKMIPLAMLNAGCRRPSITRGEHQGTSIYTNYLL